jgi:hypothetical protein
MHTYAILLQAMRSWDDQTSFTLVSGFLHRQPHFLVWRLLPFRLSGSGTFGDGLWITGEYTQLSLLFFTHGHDRTFYRKLCGALALDGLDVRSLVSLFPGCSLSSALKMCRIERCATSLDLGDNSNVVVHNDSSLSPFRDLPKALQCHWAVDGERLRNCDRS